MALWSWSGILRVVKPVAAGMGLAFLATAWVDGPPAVNFTPESPYSAKQAEIVESQAELVIERNIMKLGSLLSFKAAEPALVVPPAGAGEDESGLFFDPDGKSVPAVKGAVSDSPAVQP
ncbi:MAG: hypothetical protein AB7E51_17290 [Pseudodesulfovibrio sp.]|uniref:Uncharacterized protein n=1 Tax=Pseudodesulfovibrio indicus TaxID=1716143 RepID=A0A126QSQ1_9BACT|nr:hypothetical protein [Pseudodesulfovibrio indicus]AMK12838.1 hypothetical protein AWY79_17875 [Pseudodesulfovibrio indicus]TDT82059.1 hypothetical protein EDC59_11738 [Pseudodesulfovibrio indicus]